MNGQGPQVHANGDTAVLQGQANGYHYDAQAHGRVATPQGYTQPHMVGVNGKDVNGLAHVFGGLTTQDNRSGSKYAAPKGILTPHGGGIDVNGAQRHHGQQYMVFPNGAMCGAMPPVPAHFAQVAPQHRANQGSPLQYLPTDVYPGAGLPLVPGYHWPYSFNDNTDGPDSANPQHDFWTPVDENNPGNFTSMAGQAEHYPAVSPHDQALVAGYMYNGTPCPVPYQMMRTPGGYAWQDLDALVKQDPPIPRAVPAMWTNPSDMTLAKCLENREGITNVYIRGFLPETTDEMLHSYAARFGKIDRCKAIVDLDTSLCKGLVEFS